METAPPIEIRPAVLSDAESLGCVHARAWQEAYVGILPDETINAQSVDQRADLWRRILAAESGEPIVYVAVQRDDMVGFASCGRQGHGSLADRGYDAEIYTLYVLEIAKRRGVGRALMRRMALDLMDRGMVAATLWALADNAAALRFYEAMGGEIIDHRATPEDAALFDVALGWRDLKRLAVVTSANES